MSTTNTENNVAAQAGDEPMRENMALVIARLEQIAGNFTDDPRNAADEALVCARALLAAQVSPRATADVERDDEMLKAAILAVLKAHTQEMEGYSYFGSNPGVKEDDYEEIADEILATTKPEA